MATLKHIASKNSDYSAAETYLVYQHDEFSGKKILDEQSRPKLRESYPGCLDGREGEVRTPTRMTSRVTSISSASTRGMQPKMG